MKYVAVLDDNTGVYYLDNVKELVIEDDLGNCLVRLPNDKKIICRKELLFNDIIKAYDYLYEINRL